MARVTSTLSIASAATLESLAEEMSTVQVEAIINQSVKNFYSPLPPSLFYGASASKSGLPGDDSIDGKDKRRSDGGPGPKTASKSKSPKSVADGPQYLLRFALLVAGTLEPKTLSPVDILAYGSRILSLVRSMPMSTILIYDDRYRRGIAPLIAGGTDLTLRQCYLSDSNPALLAEVVSYSVRSTTLGGLQELCQSLWPRGTCTWGDRCRYAHDLSDKPTGSSVEAPQGDKARGRNRSSKQSDESTSHVEAKPVRSRGLGHLCGSATEADVTAVSEVVGRTAERLVPRLCTALGCSPRTAACGSPVRAELGWVGPSVKRS
ncbi:hypothetical protein FOZ62_028582, partial [Perkinsus olseni]